MCRKEEVEVARSRKKRNENETLSLALSLSERRQPTELPHLTFWSHNTPGDCFLAPSAAADSASAFCFSCIFFVILASEVLRKEGDRGSVSFGKEQGAREA